MRRIAVRCLALLTALPAAHVAAQEDGAVALQKALDRSVEFAVSDAPIDEIFGQLSEKTGVEFVLDPDTYEYLPYGRQTRLAVTLRNLRLREALTQMLSRQALQWRPEDGHVRILPSDALYRTGQRATYDELRILGEIFTSRLQPVGQGGSPIQQLRDLTDMPDLRLSFKGISNHTEAEERAAEGLPRTAAEWLDALTQANDWTWYPSGDRIVISPQPEQIRRQLQRQVSLAYGNARLVSVLFDLADRARVELRLAPGVLNRLPEQTRQNFNLRMNATIAQALEVIRGATGLEFSITNEGILVEASEALNSTTQPAAGRDRPPFIVRLSLPAPDGSEIIVFTRPDELPDELVEHILAEKKKRIEQWQDQAEAADEAPKPEPNAKR